jgi:hypothetical protein
MIIDIVVGQMKHKKFFVLMAIGLFIASSTIVYSEKTEMLRETMRLSYSQPIIKQMGSVSIIDEVQTNSQFIRSGFYQLPMDVYDLTFPLGTSIHDVKITLGSIEKYKLFSPLPVTPQARPLSMTDQLETNEAISDGRTVDTWFEYHIGSGLIDDERQIILHLEIYPVQYDDTLKTIQIADTIEVHIEYEQSEYVSQSTLVDDIYRLLIISPNEYMSGLQPLVDHKNNRNISTILVSLNDIYSSKYFPVQGRDDPEKIKYFIKNALDQWKIDNVLLVGGSEKMPTRETHIKVSNDDKEIFVSDLYYADIYNKTNGFSSWDTNGNDLFAEYNWENNDDEMDLYPDVYLGRLACIDLNEVTVVVNKIINYENGEVYTKDWFSTLIVVGGDSFPGDTDQIDEGEYVNDVVIDIMGGFVPIRLWASNGILSGVNPTGSTFISNTINQGAGFIDFSGHGNTNVYATHPHENSKIWIPTPLGGYFNSHIKELQNNEKLPIVVTGACSVGKFNKDDDCFSWSFLASPNGGGIASLGATSLGYAYIGQYVTQGLVEKMAVDMFRAYSNNVKTFGEMWAYGINRNIKSRMNGAEYKTVLAWQPFGDPTLIIADESIPPTKPILTGPSSGRSGREYTYEALSTDADGDKIYYLFDWGDGTFSEWLGPYNSGVKMSVSNIWSQKGEYQVRVACKDEHGSRSDWSDPLAVAMPFQSLMNHRFRESSVLSDLLHSLMVRLFNK